MAAAQTPVWKQFAKFTGAGFASAVGHYGLLIALVQGAGVPAVPASAAGALLGALIHYGVNHRYTFPGRRRHRETVLKFALVAAAGLVLNTAFMWVGVRLLGAHYLVSQVITTVLVLIWSFIANRFWTFRTGPAEDTILAREVE